MTDTTTPTRDELIAWIDKVLKYYHCDETCFKMYTAIRDELSTPAGWQPIDELEDEDNPEKYRILAEIKNGDVKWVCKGQWCIKYLAWMRDAFFLDNSFIYPTHWLPLPPRRDEDLTALMHYRKVRGYEDHI